MSDKLVTFRAQTAAMVRRETFEGRDHLVAPVVAVREGVLNGELLLADEIGRFVDAWNGIPLPVHHPMDQGIPISANRPDLVETSCVGRFWNASFDGRALRGELWVDIAKANELGGDALRALEQLERGEPLEVSTAYFNDMEQASGIFSGRRFNGIQRNLRPDHLALLPGGIGACSWSDGCGAPRVNTGGDGKSMPQQSLKEWPKKAWHFVQNVLGINADDLSHSDLERRLRAALKERTEWVFIHDVFDDAVVYDDQAPDKPVRLLRRSYTMDENNVVTLSDEFEEVVKVTRYEPVRSPAVNKDVPPENPPAQGSQQKNNQGQDGQPATNIGGEDKKEGSNLKKTELVSGLIANSATKFTENDRQWLEGLDEEQLAKMEPVTQPAANVQPGGETPCGRVKANEDSEQAQPQAQPQEPKTNAGQEPKPKTMEQWIAEIPDEETREFMINSQKKQKAHREKLIADLAANERCAFDKDELGSMKTNQLEKLANSLQPEDYSGQGGPRANRSSGDDNDIPAPPPVILAKKENGEGK